MNIHRRRIHLSGDSVNMGLGFRTSELFRQFQEAAGDHSIELGLAQRDLMARGLTWVLALQTVEISRLPRYGEDIVIETWPGPFKKIICPRYFQIRVLANGAGTDGDPRVPAAGEVVIRSSSVWSILDTEKRIAINPVAEGLVFNTEEWELSDGEIDEATRETLAMKRPRTVRGELPDRRVDFSVPFSYIDMNGHMNNTRYFDLAENVIFREPLAESLSSGLRFEPPELSRIDMEYRDELMPGEIVPILWREERNAGDESAEGRSFYLQGGGENPAFRMRLTYKSE